MNDRPNIVYLHSHDTGRYVQPYGYAVSTPNIQRLAEEGVLFRQAFCAAPTCSPSRAALLTGQCAHSSGMIGLAHRGFRLNDYSQHLVHTLRRAGYWSVLAGTQHVAHDPSMIGYDEISPTNRQAEDITANTVAFLKRSHDQPFFLDVGYQETHRPFPSPDPGARHCLPPAPLPDTLHTRQDMAAFKASARLLDSNIGVILQALNETGLTPNTLVICTTDHGIAFPGMKCNLTGHGIGVMLIMRGPAGFSGGMVCDALVSHIDVFPTICDLLSMTAPPWVQGRSMLPLVRGAEEIRSEIFAEVTYHASYEPQRAIRTKRWSYIRRYGGRRTPVLPNCDDSPSKDVWLNAGWRERAVDEEQLYDLIFDPGEAHNLAADPSCRPVLDDLWARLSHWMEETDDPLLRGPVAAPHGARVNDADGLSPSEPVIVV